MSYYFGLVIQHSKIPCQQCLIYVFKSNKWFGKLLRFLNASTRFDFQYEWTVGNRAGIWYKQTNWLVYCYAIRRFLISDRSNRVFTKIKVGLIVHPSQEFSAKCSLLSGKGISKKIRKEVFLYSFRMKRKKIIYDILINQLNYFDACRRFTGFSTWKIIFQN